MGKDTLSIKGTLDVAGMASVLEDLAKSMREGKVCVELGTEFVCLVPGESIELELEAAEKKGKQRLSLELSWRTAPKAIAPQAGFKISSVIPEVAASEVVEEPAAATAGGGCPEPVGIEALVPEAVRCASEPEGEDKHGKGKKHKHQ